MSWLLFILALAVAAFLFRRLRHLRRLVSELEGAARAKRRLMPRESQKALKSLGLDGLVREFNDAIDRRNRQASREVGYSKHVEAMLRAVQEVVIVFNAERKVEFANRAAERLFRRGQSLHGLRLEGIMRSLSLLELLDAPEESEDAAPRQIHIEQDNETLWFEASRARVRSVEKNKDPSTLLVLHDITRLKQLEVMRRDFVANVSHELRTPLTIIKGFAETLLEDDASISRSSRLRFLDKIVGNAERLNVLVEDLLTLSRLESKPDQLEPSVHSLKALAEDCIENYRARIDPGRQSIELDCDERVGDFAFDRFRINQVLDNLAENVFRYAPDFSRLVVRIALDEPAGLVVCAVEDDGPGIPDKDLPHVFGRFYRVDKGRSRERGGTGLGLSIVKHIVQLHGGSIHAESPANRGQATPHLSQAGGQAGGQKADQEGAQAGTQQGGQAGTQQGTQAGGQATPESRRAQAGTRIVFTLPYRP
ncbi:MAG: ATP-binding protein [Opitutales bacterium]